MPDWKAPLDIPELAAAIAARGGRKPKTAAVALGEDEATKIQESPFDGLPADVAGEWREPAKEAPSNPAAAFDLRAPSALPFEKPEPSPSPKAAPAAERPKAATEKPVALASASAAPKPAAARRNAARGGGDLFGDLAAAGSEDDESLGTDAKEAVPKMTGQRNESSVLFSLDALTKQEPKPTAKKTTPKQDDAALLMGLDSGPSSLANVGTSFGSAFAAPDFNAPVVAPAPEARAADPGGVAPYEKKKGGPGIWIALVAVLVLGGGAAAMVMSGKLASTEAPTPSAPVAAKPAETSPSPAPTPATEPTAATPTDSVAAAPSAAPATGGAAATTPAMPAAAGGAAAPVAVATPKPNEPAAKPGEKPADKPAEKPAEATAAAPFDTNAAKAALGAAAANAGSCKTADGPTGSGKVSVTFMPSGRATNTQVSGDLAGTAVGGCVAKLFRSAKVPAFAGDAVTVTKSFSVQ
ncbi:MAG: putative rane protein, partial [Polyangiaceae bacterium]|nr:putative rane protein [Polyangiaceae bacterium]